MAKTKGKCGSGITVKAKIVSPDEDKFEVVIYAGCMWRVFGTPYKDALDRVSAFANEKTARKAAGKLADELGLSLLWEASK